MSDSRHSASTEREGKIAAGFERMKTDALTPGDVVIRVKYSSINFKDALAATGAGKILRKYPLNGGIDLSGEVESSTDARYKPGQQVLVTGCGHSETLDGGYAEVARAAGDSVIPLPDGMSLFDAMALGTAGFTTGLAITAWSRTGRSRRWARSS
jgi:NADPH2:quinone reductase